MTKTELHTSIVELQPGMHTFPVITPDAKVLSVSLLCPDTGRATRLREVWRYPSLRSSHSLGDPGAPILYTVSRGYGIVSVWPVPERKVWLEVQAEIPVREVKPDPPEPALNPDDFHAKVRNSMFGGVFAHLNQESAEKLKELATKPGGVIVGVDPASGPDKTGVVVIDLSKYPRYASAPQIVTKTKRQPSEADRAVHRAIAVQEPDGRRLGVAQYAGPIDG